MNRIESFFVGLIVGFLVGGALVGAGLQHDWRAACIQRGAAEYHPQTGKFQWKQSESN